MTVKLKVHTETFSLFLSIKKTATKRGKCTLSLSSHYFICTSIKQNIMPFLVSISRIPSTREKSHTFYARGYVPSLRENKITARPWISCFHEVTVMFTAHFLKKYKKLWKYLKIELNIEIFSIPGYKIYLPLIN